MEIPAETLDVQLFFPPVSAAYRKSFFRPLIFLYYINTKAFQIYIKCFIKIFHFFFVKIIQGNFPHIFYLIAWRIKDRPSCWRRWPKENKVPIQRVTCSRFPAEFFFCELDFKNSFFFKIPLLWKILEIYYYFFLSNSFETSKLCTRIKWKWMRTSDKD